MLEVSRSGFYEWTSRKPAARTLEDQELTKRITKIHTDSRQTYGAPRIHAELGFEGVLVGKKRVARLMRQAGISGLFTKKWGKTTIRTPGIRTAPDLVERDFLAIAVNKLWVADIECH